MTRSEAVRLIEAARTPVDLFGDDGTRAYRRLARLVHPDAGGPREAFDRLTSLWRAYGPVTITTRRGTYPLGATPVRGDLANLYDAGEAVVKIARDPAVNDLLEREAIALRQLPKDGDGRFLPYVPRLVESFRHRDETTGLERRVNAIGRLEGFRPLTEVRAAYPDGVDPRDVAWMWRRLLVGLGFAHGAGVLHGAVLPEHVLIHPREHGLVLVDWCYSVPGCHPDRGDRVPAMVTRRADWYPPEVAARRPAGAGTDIYLATRCMTYLMGDRAPRPLRAFARGCLLTAENRRPQDAWRLLGELDDLLERLYGPRRFRPFHLPG
ncbi:molecular chaperone DnaJ [Actinomadura sp. DC4]|uniref:molecular chaperone DnaJ n=1 Tax=Actinomadura sp. DC4 TaxID=3055069 RepID=UPI0025B274AE|nr:molecular chaperone DnaJ [Actinomadura sp. DC4]MDN3353317.1 molecular chaperone DnaJ [Actinomadura sp. DC4]